jgi:hypothetical protein
VLADSVAGGCWARADDMTINNAAMLNFMGFILLK